MTPDKVTSVVGQYVNVETHERAYILHLPKPDMKSKTTKQILDETPQEVRDEVKSHGDRVVDKWKEKALREAWNEAINACKKIVFKYQYDTKVSLIQEIENLKK